MVVARERGIRFRDETGVSRSAVRHADGPAEGHGQAQFRRSQRHHAVNRRFRARGRARPDQGRPGRLLRTQAELHSNPVPGRVRSRAAEGRSPVRVRQQHAGADAGDAERPGRFAAGLQRAVPRGFRRPARPDRRDVLHRRRQIDEAIALLRLQRGRRERTAR